MKQLFFATGFAVLAIAGYSGISAGYKGYYSGAGISDYSISDTTPKKKKDSTHKWGKDSLNKKDTTRPRLDTSRSH